MDLLNEALKAAIELPDMQQRQSELRVKKHFQELLDSAQSDEQRRLDIGTRLRVEGEDLTDAEQGELKRELVEIDARKGPRARAAEKIKLYRRGLGAPKASWSPGTFVNR